MATKTKLVDPDILMAVHEQIKELEPGLKKQIKIDAVLKELTNLKNLIAGTATNEAKTILSDIINRVTDIQSGKKDIAAFGEALGNLDTLEQLFKNGASLESNDIVASIIRQIETLLQYRPDVQSILSDLEAIKHLKGGPADATAFHDFHVLQIAFKNVWKHAFDKNLQGLVEQVYLEHTKLYEDAGLQLPPFGAINDISQLEEFIGFSAKSISPPADLQKANPDYDPNKVMSFMGIKFDWNTVPAMIPSINLDTVLNTFGAGWHYWRLSPEQQYWVWEKAAIVNDPSKSPAEKDEARKIASIILNNPEGPGGRIVKLIYKIGLALSEPYAFDIFAPGSYNFGLMLTYRQKWEPGEYQAGNLVATIPLAPGEVRKYSKKQSVKRTRAEKEIEKSVSSGSYQTSETSRAEAEIMKKTTTATNFKMSADGSFNIGIGSIHSSTEFGANLSTESANNKKEFHEATIKAAQDYRLERTLEVDTTSVVETEETSSGEIANPNNEITVTYLFYELQRRYKISEFLYRVRPIILVALDVPSPHEIDESWLLQYQWILARVLLDDSFRVALNYLSSGMAGDEVSIEIIKANWEKQKQVVDILEAKTQEQLRERDKLREALVNTTLEKDLVPHMPGALKFFTFGADPTEGVTDALEAQRKAAETRLQYVEQALADAQEKLKQSTGTFQQATKDYAAAMQNQYSRHIAIDQLRIHVKQNILYYMQAIWNHKVADQTFFELYKLPVDCPEPGAAVFSPGLVNFNNMDWATFYGNMPAPSSNWNQHELIEMADLDNPLGYKGNYIIFPLKGRCYLTTFMLREFIDDYTRGLRDPDKVAYFLENFPRIWEEAISNGQTTIDGEVLNQQDLKTRLEDYVTTARRTTDEIIVPTDQLFIEALPGTHPLLEDFKLLHRVEDVRKVKAEVRHAELENLRLAERIIERKLEDPDIEKKIVVERNAAVNIGTD